MQEALNKPRHSNPSGMDIVKNIIVTLLLLTLYSCSALPIDQAKQAPKPLSSAPGIALIPTANSANGGPLRSPAAKSLPTALHMKDATSDRPWTN